jgi:hypothetical protein
MYKKMYGIHLAQGSGLGVWCLVFGVLGVGFKGQRSEIRVGMYWWGLRIEGFRSRVQNSGLRYRVYD